MQSKGCRRISHLEHQSSAVCVVEQYKQNFLQMFLSHYIIHSGPPPYLDPMCGKPQIFCVIFCLILATINTLLNMDVVINNCDIHQILFFATFL